MELWYLFFLDINYVFCQYLNANDKSLSKISEFCIFWSWFWLFFQPFSMLYIKAVGSNKKLSMSGSDFLIPFFFVSQKFCTISKPTSITTELVFYGLGLGFDFHCIVTQKCLSDYKSLHDFRIIFTTEKSKENLFNGNKRLQSGLL